MGLSGRVVFVAGSSRGIGKAIAKGFIGEGARVAISGRGERDLVAAAADVGASAEDRVLAIRSDLTRPDEIERARLTIEERWALPHVLVANLGTGRGRPGWDMDDSDWDTALEANLRGSVRLVRAFLSGMVARRSGSIILVGSIAGLEASSAPLPYSAAKAALVSYSKNLSRQVGPEGVRVNVVAPGNVLFPGGSWERRQLEDPVAVSRMLEMEVPLKRFGTPQEIADLVVFLASDRAGFITGACFVADGGQTRIA